MRGLIITAGSQQPVRVEPPTIAQLNVPYGMSLVAKLADAAAGLGAWVRKGRRLRPPAQTWKLNVGSGLVVAPGWTNLDVSVPTLIARFPPTAHRLVHRVLPDTSAIKRDYGADEFSQILQSNHFVHHDVRYGLPVPNASVSFIYTSHFLEHLHREDATAFLHEAKRALTRGGVLRICVPDLDHVLSLFAEGTRDEALQFFFLGKHASEFTRHRYLWDFSGLRQDLQAAGFAEVHRRAFREGITPDIQLLDNRPDETLYVEAVA